MPIQQAVKGGDGVENILCLDRVNSIDQELDLEAFLGDREIPEAMLEDDHHLLGILLLQAARQHHARSLRIEGDIEMMLARQAALREHLGEDLAHDAAQGLLRQRIVVDRAFGGHADPCVGGQVIG